MNDLFTEAFEERASIREFDGHQSREDAEAAAREEVKEQIFRSMVRQLLKWRADGQGRLGREWIAKQPPGEQERYKDAANAQWSRGGRGAWNDWRE